MTLTAADVDRIETQLVSNLRDGGTMTLINTIRALIAQARLAIKSTDLLRDLVHAHDGNDMGEVIALIQEATVMLDTPQVPQ